MKKVLEGVVRKLSETEEIGPLENHKEDILIACASFEERSNGVASRLATAYKTKCSFIFKYNKEDKRNLREQNYQMMKRYFEDVSDLVLPIFCDIHDPVDGISRFLADCKAKGISIKMSRITVDITTFTKQYLLVLLRLIENSRPSNVRLLYTEPEDYASKWGEPLSRGVVDIVSVPSYAGHYDLAKENLLVLMLGYEGDRALAIWEELAPKKTIVLLGQPGYKSVWKSRVKTFNKELLKRLPPRSKSTVHTLDPFSVSKKLERLFREHHDGYNISISPLGPKPQVVGCFLSIMNYPDTQVVYAIPKHHNPDYSKALGETWEYR